jgi:stearoyl-CoA desaturase (delta-9 desaturase)
VNSSTALPTPQNRQINWVTLIALILFHLGALAAPFFFEWKAVLLAVLLYWMCIGWGIGMGYHRLHTHRSYKSPKWIEYLFAVLGTMTLEGGPIFWVATHRIHHQRSDQEGDPHSPRDGVFWSHMGWIIFGSALHNNTAAMAKYAPDMAKDRFYCWLNNWHWVPLALSGVGLAYLGLPYLLWGVFARVVVGLHATWLVNSATHLWGYRRFITRDDSRNNWWVALLTFGEGWHNNHHAHPASARHGLTWYELDITWIQIRVLGWLKLVRNLQVAKLPAAKAAKQAA